MTARDWKITGALFTPVIVLCVWILLAG